MIKGVYYEVKKVLHNKVFWGLVFVFLCVNCYRISQLGAYDPAVSEGEVRLYQELKGELTDEKIDFVVDNYVRYKGIIEEGTYSREENTEETYTGYIHGDYVMFSELFAEWKELYEYRYYCRDIAERAAENVRFFEERDNTFEAENNRAIIERYSDREIKNFYHKDVVRRYVEYDFSGVFIILLLLLISSELIFVENKTKMNYVIDCSSYGGMRFLGTKVVFLLFMTTVLAVVFYGADFAFFQIFYDMEGLSDPLFSIMEYKNTPVDWSVFGYQMVSIAIKIVGFQFFAILTFLFSYLFLNQIYTVIFGAVSFVAFVFVCENTRWVLNPVLLLINHNLFSGYQVMNIFHRPVPVIAVSVVTVLAVLALMILFLFWKHRGTNLSERLIKKGV